MKKTGFTFALLMLLGSMMFAQKTWVVDASHSSIEFAVAHMVISETTGEFGEYDINLVQKGDDFSNSRIEATIQVKSINTDDEKRDGHLRSADFFNVEEFPTITFTSTTIKKVDDKNYKLMGDFTMLGVTKSVTFDMKYNGTVKDPWGNTKSGFKATTTVNRTDFGLKYNSVMEAGGLMIGEDVDITLNIEMMLKG